MFNSNEDITLIDPIINSKPQRIYYFICYIKKTHQKDINLEQCKKNIEIIRDNLQNVKIFFRQIDYTNVRNIVKKINRIIRFEKKRQRNCQIFLNPRRTIPAIACYIVYGIWDCELFYNYGEYYDGKKQYGKLFFEYPIPFPFQKPSIDLIRVLKIIDEFCKSSPYNEFHQSHIIKKKDLLPILEKKGFITSPKKPRSERSSVNSLYSQLHRRYLNNLESLKYVKVLNDKKCKEILITNLGKEILEIFKFYI